MGSRVFDLTQLLKTDKLPDDVEEIAKRLSEITWG